MVLLLEVTLKPKADQDRQFPMIFGYVRVSNHDQSLEGQKNLISRYSIDQKLIIDEWIELEMSSKNLPNYGA